MLKKWDDLPENMKNESVRKYYDLLCKKRFNLFVKRIFDIIVSLIASFILLPVFLVLSIVIKMDSNGPVIFRQVRVTQYEKQFCIFKFRTMVANAESIGNQVTSMNDMRVTKVGRFLRKYRLDEIPQLLNIISGDMTFVGTRPEVVKYVEKYTEDMMATLLLPAGVTSEASIEYKDEEKILTSAENADETYVKLVLPEKMKFNLRSIEKFNLLSELKTMVRTVFDVASKDHAVKEKGKDEVMM